MTAPDELRVAKARIAELLTFVEDVAAVLDDLLCDEPEGPPDPDEDPLIDLRRRAISLAEQGL